MRRPRAQAILLLLPVLACAAVPTARPTLTLDNAAGHTPHPTMSTATVPPVPAPTPLLTAPDDPAATTPVPAPTAPELTYSPTSSAAPTSPNPLATPLSPSQSPSGVPTTPPTRLPHPFPTQFPTPAPSVCAACATTLEGASCYVTGSGSSAIGHECTANGDYTFAVRVARLFCFLGVSRLAPGGRSAHAPRHCSAHAPRRSARAFGGAARRHAPTRRDAPQSPIPNPTIPTGSGDVKRVRAACAARQTGGDSVGSGKDTLCTSPYLTLHYIALHAMTWQMGGYSVASGKYAFAGGVLSEASGSVSFAFGDDAVSSGVWSTAHGHHAYAMGEKALAVGHTVTA